MSSLRKSVAAYVLYISIFLNIYLLLDKRVKEGRGGSNAGNRRGDHFDVKFLHLNSSPSSSFSFKSSKEGNGNGGNGGNNSSISNMNANEGDANGFNSGNLCIQSYSSDGQCGDVYPGYHGQRLTHVIIPFHTSHVSKLENNLKLWQDNPPCSRQIGNGSGGFGPPSPNGPFHLVLYSSADSRKKQYISELETRLQYAIGNLTTEVVSCFQSIEIQHANLSGPSDTYYKGTRLMIEKLILGKVKLAYNPNYMFYMEPDCIPIRSNWLNALDLQTRWPITPFWMKGSVYRGSNKGVYATRHPPQYFHINGNSIYNIGDRHFKSFYVKHYRPFINSVSKQRERSFDTDLYRFLHDLDNIQITKTIKHKFVYSEIVLNYWRSSYSLSKIKNEFPYSYLIHGGYQKP